MRDGKTLVSLIVALLFNASAQAKTFELGEIDLSGNFTLNHLYDFNKPGALPFGVFGPLTVQNATRIFTPYVSNGDVLSMNTPDLWVSAGNTPVEIPFFGGVLFGTLSQPMQWTVGGFTFDTLWDNITGADFAGQSCSGITDPNIGHGFDLGAYLTPNNPRSVGGVIWTFTAPPYDITNFPSDITGPINPVIKIVYENGVVAEGGSALSLLIMGCSSLIGLKLSLAWKGKLVRHITAKRPCGDWIC